MQKKSITEILITAALIGGAVYFLFYTERGQMWLERLKNTAADQMDEWLEDLEKYLADLEHAAQQHERQLNISDSSQNL